MYICLKRNLNFKGWNSHVHREFPGDYESTNLSREIGRTADPQTGTEGALGSLPPKQNIFALSGTPSSDSPSTG